MDNGSSTAVISVRAHAQRQVDPDSAQLQFGLHARGANQLAARAGVHELFARITAALAAVGGVPESLTSDAAPLTWRVHSLHSYADSDSRGRDTGHHKAHLGAVVVVRDFTLLGQVESAIGAYDKADLHGISWFVDHDNEAWPLVRTDAIAAALRKAADYAAALGGEVLAVEQVSDVGLLTDSGHAGIGDDDAEMAFPVAASAGRSFPSDGVGLDPVPQPLEAVVEARLRVSVGPLPR